MTKNNRKNRGQLPLIDVFSTKPVTVPGFPVTVPGFPPDKRAEILALIDMFNAKAVDVGPKYIMVEVSGPETKIEAFIESCRPYGIKNMVRTGTVAMARYNRTTPDSMETA